MENSVMSFRDVTAHLEISTSTLNRYIRKGYIQGRKVGVKQGKWVFEKATVEELKEKLGENFFK